METYDLVDALQAHQGQRHSKSSQQTSETSLLRDKPHYGIFHFSTVPDPEEIDLTQNSSGAFTMRSLSRPLKYRAS